MVSQFAIFLLSASVIAYEILLIRLLSIISWQHFAAMILSLALLGYGVSGTFLAFARRSMEPRFTIAFSSFAALFGLTGVVSFAIGQRMAFNPLELPWNWRQAAILGGLYLLFAVPFFCAATAIGLAFLRAQGRIAGLYRADLLGAGAGAIGILILLSQVSAQTCLAVASGGGFTAAAVSLISARRLWSAFLLAATLSLMIITVRRLPLEVSEFKPLAQALRVPGTRIASERLTPLGLLTTVESSEVPLRFAPGLSLNYSDELPEQAAVFTDAGGITVIHRFDQEKLAFLDYTTAALPYFIRPIDSVLVVGAAGSEALNGWRHGAARIQVVEVNEAVVDLMTRRYRDYSGRVLEREGVEIAVRQPRTFLEVTAHRYSLIADSSAAGSGLPMLAENYLYTVEGMTEMLRHLSSNGMVCITRPLNLPPRDSVKLVITAIEALERLGIRSPASHIAMVRNWNSVSVLLSRTPFSSPEVQSIVRFCEERSFDTEFVPGVARSAANRFNLMDQPYLHDAVVAATSGERAKFIREYKFNVGPSTDNRPYFGHSFRWKSLPEILRLRLRGGAFLLETGYLILIATLLQAIAAAVLFILVPVVMRKGAASRWLVICFSAMGLSFLFVEIFLIQKLTMLLGHPILAVSITLATMLALAGVGSGLSRHAHSVVLPVAGIVILLGIYALGWPAIFGSLVSFPESWKLMLSILMISPLALLMGMPFPIALAKVGAIDPQSVALAWSVNGFASVISPVAATLVGIHLGFAAVALLACLGYLFVGLATPRLRRI